jgi:hypothetical protein
VLETEPNLHSTVDFGQISTWDHLWGLEADTNLESSWAPVHELNSTLGLESSHSVVNVLGNDISAVQKASSHVLSVLGIALDHLVVLLEARHGDLLDRVGLVVGLGRGDNGRIGDKREMNTRIGYKVGLELVQVDVQGAIKAKRRSDGGDN